MSVRDLVFPLFAASLEAPAEASLARYVGNSFMFALEGNSNLWLATCAHVVGDLATYSEAQVGQEILVFHSLEHGREEVVQEIRRHPRYDLALVRLSGSSRKGVPTLYREDVCVGLDVRCQGFYVPHRTSLEVRTRFLKGYVTRMPTNSGEFPTLQPTGETLCEVSFPGLVGFSGSPVYCMHDDGRGRGAHVAGMLFGNADSRIAEGEVLEYEDEDLKMREGVYRIVEFGLCYRIRDLVEWAQDLDVDRPWPA